MIKTFSIYDIIIIYKRNSINAYKWQRKFNWKEDRVEKFFRSIFDNYSIGTILVTENNTEIESIKIGDDYKIVHKARNRPDYLIIDGFQRLFTIIKYVSDDGYAGKKLYFNKYYGINGDIPFKLFKPENVVDSCSLVDVTKEMTDDDTWIPVKKLFSKFIQNTNSYQEVAKVYNPNNFPIVNENIFKFYYYFFYSKNFVFVVNNIHISDIESIKKIYKSYKESGVKLNFFDILKCLFNSLGNDEFYHQYSNYIKEANNLISKYEKVKQFVHNCACIREEFDDIKYISSELKKRKMDANIDFVLSIVKNPKLEFANKVFILCCNKIGNIKRFSKDQFIDSLDQFIDYLIENANIIKSLFQSNQIPILLKVIDCCLKLSHITSIPITDPKYANIIISLYTQIKENDNFVLFEFLLKYVKAQLCKYFFEDKDVDLFAYIIIMISMHEDIQHKKSPSNPFDLMDKYGDECELEKKKKFSDVLYPRVLTSIQEIEKNYIKLEWDKREQEINNCLSH